ncbi:LuxR C-terminal-related transcriptional regulator [Streptomyces sp. NPDC001315]|uniref:response regulator transcription factor n=1 Tax=Streptomyces sp. NPDC001315 TaxID=3364562 RepID=UPI00369D537C
MLVFDRRIALIPLDPSNTRAGALRTEEPAVVGNLLVLFEQAWETAIPLGNRTAEAGPEVSATEKELLKLLAGGITDEAAARRLGVSMRTVRRQMASLMERLEATSRFEAGLKAARQGWL